MVDNLENVKKYLSIHQEEAFNKCTDINKKNNLDKVMNFSSFNGLIGGKNRTYNLDIRSFNTAQEYVNAWIMANETLYQEEKIYGIDKSSVRIHNLLDDKFVKDYVAIYLTKIFLNSKISS